MLFYDLIQKPVPALEMRGDNFKVCCSDYETIAIFADYQTATDFIRLIQDFCNSRGLINLNDLGVKLVKEVEEDVL